MNALASVADDRFYTVRVECLVTDDQRDEDDHDVPDVWDTALPAGSEDWSPGQCATHVLDRFHESVAIAMLEDFEIRVFDPNGVEIFEEDPEPTTASLLPTP
jgi:hypothetical protein